MTPEQLAERILGLLEDAAEYRRIETLGLPYSYGYLHGALSGLAAELIREGARRG